MSVRAMIEHDLGLEAGYLQELAARSSSLYSNVIVRGRTISAPSIELKLVQTWIGEFVRSEVGDLPRYVTAYESGRSIANNALLHSHDAHLLLLDIHHFFPSCSASLVEEFFAGMSYVDETLGRRSSMAPADAALFARLSCFNDGLAVGSPSSPFLANRVMLPIDERIIAALPSGCVYSRYSDDICISSGERIDEGVVVPLVRGILEPYGFRLNDDKTRCYGRGDSRCITGVFVTPEGNLSLGPARKRDLRRRLYRVLMGRDAGEVDVLEGHMNFCRQVDPDYLNRLLAKYSSYGSAMRYGGVMPALRAIAGGDRGLIG